MVAKIKKLPRSSGLRHPHKPRGISKNAFQKVYWPYIPLLVVIGCLVSVGIRTGAFNHRLEHINGRVLSYSTSMNLDKLLQDTNAARSQNSSSTLSLNDSLDKAAQSKANDMATRNYWSHNTPDGTPPWKFATDENYSYAALGENLATGFSDERSTIDGWLASSSHRHNLLNPLYSEVGFGVANNPNYTSAGGGPMTIVVALYGKPSLMATQIEKAQTLGLTTSEVATSHAQLALSNFPISGLGTILAVSLALGTFGFWVSRHVLALRRVLVKGEAYVIKHPLSDIGLIAIGILAYLLSQTAGFIK